MNVFENIPYREEGMGRRKLVDEKHLLVMQIALKPGQSVPVHDANSNVHLLVLEGSLSIELNGLDTDARKGDILPVAFKTSMSIRNISEENSSFLVIKTPNPSEMR
jgi:quercetin dioxygenase-like cupin family protein